MDEDKIQDVTDKVTQDTVTQDTVDQSDDNTSGNSTDNISRIREMRKAFKEQGAKLRKYEEAEAKQEEAKKLEQGKYEDVLNAQKSQHLETLNKLKDVTTTQAIEAEIALVKPQWKNLMAKETKALLEYDESGEITNLSEAIDQVKSNYPDAFRSNDKYIPAPQSTTGEGGVKISKERALEILNSGDNRMYVRHEAEILEALKS